MDLLTAVLIAEGSQDVETEDEVLEAWQYLVDTGVVWSLQGTYGRTASDLIEAGLVSA